MLNPFQQVSHTRYSIHSEGNPTISQNFKELFFQKFIVTVQIFQEMLDADGSYAGNKLKIFLQE